MPVETTAQRNLAFDLLSFTLSPWRASCCRMSDSRSGKWQDREWWVSRYKSSCWVQVTCNRTNKVFSLFSPSLSFSLNLVAVFVLFLSEKYLWFSYSRMAINMSRRAATFCFSVALSFYVVINHQAVWGRGAQDGPPRLSHSSWALSSRINLYAFINEVESD